MILKSTDEAQIIADIQTILPAYTGGRYTARLNSDKEVIQYDAEGNPTNENTDSPSGYRVDVIPKGQEVLQTATYDESGTELTAAVLGDYTTELKSAVLEFPQLSTLAIPDEGEATIEGLKEEVERLKDVIDQLKAGVVATEISNEKVFEPGKKAVKGQEITFEGDTYTVRQTHIMQADWTPPAVLSLFIKKVSLVPGSDAIQWEPGIALEVGNKVVYNSIEYEVIQAHTTQVGWEPPSVPSLFSEIP